MNEMLFALYLIAPRYAQELGAYSAMEQCQSALKVVNEQLSGELKDRLVCAPVTGLARRSLNP